MKLIDADALVEELLNGINADTDKSVQASFAKSVCMILCKSIERQQTVDAVPVIRCKDCKWYIKQEWVVGGGYYIMCRNGSIANAKKDDYCSRAERKEE